MASWMKLVTSHINGKTSKGDNMRQCSGSGSSEKCGASLADGISPAISKKIGLVNDVFSPYEHNQECHSN